jgi:predicted  nucleic acid-binding Zn-ribbon protein
MTTTNNRKPVGVKDLNTNHILLAIAGFLAAHQFGIFGKTDEDLSEKISRIEIQLTAVQSVVTELRSQTADRYRSSDAARDFSSFDRRISVLEDEIDRRSDWMSTQDKETAQIKFKMTDLERRVSATSP